jgi:hypothetical protein
MRKILFVFLYAFSFLFMVTSCYYDNEVDLYPGNTVPCDTSNVTYSQRIAPIMTSNCNVCHNTATASGGVITDNWPGLSIVAKDGRLWNSVNWVNGLHNMPQGGSKLGNCDLAKINIWIKADSPDN